MNRSWIVKIDRDRASDLARLRDVVSLEVAEKADVLWLRAPADDERLERMLATVAGQRFLLTDGEQLVPCGKRVPTERLPRLDWMPLAQWATVSLPVAALPADSVPRLRLRLVRGGAERRPAALLTDLQSWLAYATQAPEVRLNPLAFAAANDQRAFILGTPLPPLAGQPYTRDKGIATPCGWSLLPAVGSHVIHKLLALADDDLALFHLDGSFERIASEHFVRASRSAVRATAEAMAHV